MAHPGDIEWIGGPQNPMTNLTVIDVLMEVCELEDLARLRLVCKTWYNASLTRFRANKVFQISEDVRRGKYRVDGTLGIRDALRILEQPEIARKPFQKFYMDLKLKPCAPWENEFIDFLPMSEDYEDFWTVVGPKMISLHIDYDDQPLGWDLARWILDNCRRLQKLKVVQCITGEVWFKANHVSETKLHTSLTFLEVEAASHTPCTPWGEILTFFPNLKQIIIDPCSYNLDAIRGAFLAMNPVDRVSRRLEITFNDDLIANNRNRALLDKLVDFPGVSMKGLILTREHGNGTAFEDMIRICHAKSTNNPVCLELCDLAARCTEINIELERLLGAWQPFLSEIALTCTMIRNLHFLNDSPNLKVLTLYEIRRSVLEASLPGNMPILEQLKTVKVGCFELGHLCEDDIRLFSKLGPNVTTFIAPLNNCSFRALCLLMPEIRRLKIRRLYGTDALDDFGLTGILVDTIRLPDAGEIVRPPNIKNLKYLEAFEGVDLNLSDSSIYDGFLQMDFLVKVRVMMSKQTSDSAFLALWNRFPSIRRSELVEGYWSKVLNERLHDTSKILHRHCWIYK